MVDAKRLDGSPLRPAAASVQAEKQKPAACNSLSDRIRNEFREMPGTCLTAAQASRLFGILPGVSIRILHELVEEGVLKVTPEGRYHLRSPAA